MENKGKTKEEILAETYGCFESEKTADEIIDEIYNSRHFERLSSIKIENRAESE